MAVKSGSAATIDLMECPSGSLTFIDFSKKGASSSVIGRGWSVQEDAGVWMIGASSELLLPPVRSLDDHRLQILLEPYVRPPLCCKQPIKVSINGVSVGSQFVDRRCYLSLKIPAERFRVDETIGIILEHAGFAVPSMLKDNTDDRPLALRVFGLWFWTDCLLNDPPIHPDFGSSLPSVFLENAVSANNTSEFKSGVETYTFGNFGTIKPYLLDGWHGGENGFAWTIAKKASLRLPIPSIASPLLVKISMRPPFIPQTFSVSSSGQILGQYRVAEYETVSFPVNPELLVGAQHLILQFDIADAVCPRDLGQRDDRLLGLCVEKLELETIGKFVSSVVTARYHRLPSSIRVAERSALFLDLPDAALSNAITTYLRISSLSDLLKRTEGLGDNCEYGMVQRKLGVEVLGFLRFANISLQSLINALSEEFLGALDPKLLSFDLNDENPREYSLSLRYYDVRWHTFIFEKDGLSDEEKSKQIAKLSYLRRRFYEGLTTARKIYVLKDTESRDLDRFMPVLVALNRYGPNTLLVVMPAPTGVRPGTVDLIGPGLMLGYIDQFALRESVVCVEPSRWLRVLANAWALTIPNKNSS